MPVPWIGGAGLLFLLALFLIVLTVPSRMATGDTLDFRMTGWATVEGGTTGGAGGRVVTASTPEDLVAYMAERDPLVIRVVGTIDLQKLASDHPAFKSNGRYAVASNKTLIGVGKSAHITRGDLRISGKRNVIVRNIRFSRAPDTAVGISGGTTHVWIDHNDFSDARDGLLDITTEADLITVSWNRFSDHNKVSLVGASDGHEADRGRLRVTYHHNWFSNTTQRHARVRYGKVHLFNNYFTEIDSYAIGIGVEAKIISESNFIDGAREAWRRYDSPQQPGYLKDSGSRLVKIAVTPEPLSHPGNAWSPADFYSYVLDPVEDVPEQVRRGAGIGIIETDNTALDADADPPEDRPARVPIPSK